ncbi:MAG: hypothetical protein IKB55_05500 [Clostridia bacterium]|nr:hypothetical protein [Clostridia bacterium]
MKIQFEKWIYISVPLIVILSAAGCHIYNFTNQAEILAPFVSINKSVWEYLKTLFYPVLMFWTAAYFARYKLKISRTGALSGAALSAIVSPIMTVMLYYFYICAFGIHSRAIDFMIATLSVMVSQFTAYYLCMVMYPSKRQGVYAVTAVLIMLTAFIIFTYYPPKLPLFMDLETGTYGIRRIMD